MKHGICTLAFLLLSSASIFAQTPPWAWAKGIGETNNDLGYSVANDLNGDVVITGGFSGSQVNFGGTYLTSAGSMDIVIAKYDPLGNVIWAKSAGGTGDDYGYSITTDGTGNIYITGSFSSSVISFGSFTLNNTGDADIFIAKYDPSGNFLWAKSASGSGEDHGWSVGCDNNDNPYITGKFMSPSINFGSGDMTNAGNWDIFIAKYNPSGTLIWANRFGGKNWDNANCITMDKLGKMYVAGYFESSILVLGNDTLIETDSASFYGDAFIARMDESGNFIWAKNAGGSDWDECSGVVADNSGNAYLSGYFKSATISFDGISINNTGAGFYDVFIAKYDSLGNVIWATKAGGLNDDFANAIDLENNGKICISGNFSSPTIDFDGINIVNKGLYDIFVARYDTSGNAVWVKSAGNNDIEGCNTISADQLGNIYITGAFMSDSVVFGNFTILNSDFNSINFDILIARIDTNSITSIYSQLPENISVNIFPNPTEKDFYLTVPDDAVQITILNSAGQIVKNTFVEKQQIFHFELYENGVFFIRVITPDRTLTKKLVICK